MNFNNPFSSSPNIQIYPETQVVFVADLFVQQYVGGAELTTEALISKSPVKTQKILSKDVTVDLLEQGHKKHWVFGNFAALNLDLIPTIVANMSYSVLEYDYKYCQFRSPEKHKFVSLGKGCDCDQSEHGKIISAFFYGAKSLWWMSEGQQEHYYNIFPFLSEKYNSVLSSVFSDDFFVKIKEIRNENKEAERKGWIVLGSNSWIKGADQAEQWCKDNKKDYEIVWNLPYEEVLAKLGTAEGFVYLPQGSDTCPRMVIEAKLLGCKLHLNDYVQHKDEEWFSTDNILEIEEYLYGSRALFWNRIMSDINYKPSISGYTTTYNCIDQEYPYESCVASMLEFCEEVVVVDGGSTDGTWEKLTTLAETEERLKIHQITRDWSHKRFAVFDGEQKAEARKLCTKEYCWQMDADEVATDNIMEKVTNFCRSWPKAADLVSFPVVEFWGSEEKVRVDVNPWKWRLSKNLTHITHGIPAELRKTDEDGDLYAAPGTDGCDYVHVDTGERIPHATFYNEPAHNARVHALNGNEKALEEYEAWFKNCVNLLPGVKHYSWMNISRKIMTYKNYWQKHWESLYDIAQEDTPENNMFFDKKWSDVTEEEVHELAKKLASETGGHVFHAKIDWERPTPYIKGL